MPGTATAAKRIREVRALYHKRTAGPTVADQAYRGYAFVLLAVVVAFPVVRAFASSLAQPAALAALTSPAAVPVVTGVCGILLAGVAALGAVRGPVLLPPFFTIIVAGTDLPRARTLRRPHWSATTTLALVLTAVSGLLAAVLAVTGPVSTRSAVSFVVASACFGVLAGVPWLGGQCLGARRGWVLSAVLLGATVITAAVPQLAALTPWGWVGRAWPTTPPQVPVTLIPLVIVSIISSALVPRLLDSLGGPRLLDHAHRWKSAEMAALSGDVAGALATFRARPHVGRSWPAIIRSPSWMRFIVRDLVGALRTPVRFVNGVVFFSAGAFVSALAFVPSPLPTWLPAAVGAAVGYLSAGVFTDGFRHAADVAAAPPLFGYTTVRLYARHAMLPLCVALLCTGAGMGASILLGAPLGALGTGVLLAFVIVAVRGFDSAKGFLPPMLLTPVPTAAGDLSGLMILAWQADALLIVGGAGAVLGATSTTGAALTTMVLAAVMILVVLAMAAHRVRNL